MTQKRRNLWKQLIAAMLAIILMVTSTDLQVFAMPADENTEMVTDVLEISEDSQSEETVPVESDAASQELQEEEYPNLVEDAQREEMLPEQEQNPEQLILSEVEEERREDSKTFRLNDGNYLIAQYGIPVHYETEAGTWEEIDHSLTATDTGTDDEGFETTEKSGNRDRIKFSKKLKERKTVSIKNTEFPLSWGFAGAQKQTVEFLEETEAADIAEADVTEEEKAKKNNEKFLRFDDSSETLLYADIYEHVDVTYEVMSSGIKENLILKHAGAQTSFEIAYDIGKLEAVQEDPQTISLMNGEEMVYQIQAPFMVDDAGNRSEDVTLEITEIKNKKLTVLVEADEAWLQDETRVYPVILDPVVFTKTTRSTIDSTFIASGQSSTNFSGKLELLVGKESQSYKNCRTLVKFELPKLKPGDMIVDADLNLYLYQMDFYASTTPDLQVNAHTITDSWTLSGVKWSNKPSYDSTVLDYNFLERGEEGFQPFDITEAVKGWYEGDIENNGILLKSYNEDGSYADTGVKAYFWPERYNDIDEAYPIIQIEYRNNKGLEDYWSYTTLGAGTAGTAYVNDYTGNLVFVHEDVATTGNLLPVTLQHVYNGYMMNKKFTGSYLMAGRGWKLSIQQTVLSSSEYGLTGEVQKAYPYAYEDGDGTVHFFYKKTEDGKTKYLDEDGLGLELAISGSNKTITDKDDNVMTFDSYGNLTSIEDANDNLIDLLYIDADDGTRQITRVIDGAGHNIRFTKSDSGYFLRTVTDPAGRTTTYTYNTYGSTSNVSITRITYPDGSSSVYTYNADGAMVTARSADGSGLKFYYTEDDASRVCKVEELAADGTVGQTITFDRSKYNTTLVQTSGKDDVFGNDDDLITTYRFDNWGRTVLSNTKTASSVHYGGESISYTSGAVNSSGSNIKQINKVSGSSYAGRSVPNLLKNHGAENSDGWTKSYWQATDSQYSASMTTEEKLYGERSFKLTGTSVPSDGGAAYYQDLESENEVPGKTYTFSAYVKTKDVEKANTLDKGYGACLAVRITTAEGYERIYSDYREATTSTAINKGWVRLSLTYEVPEGATNVRACLVLRNATGTAYFDGVQVENSSGANSYNMLENASFERISSGESTNWTIYNGNDNDGYQTSSYFNGAGSLRLKGEGSKSKYAYQQVPVSGTEKDIYIISGWAKAEAVPDQGDDKRPFDIYAVVYYTDGTSVLKSNKAEFNRDVSGWQRSSTAFDLSDGTDKTKTPEKISVGIRYSNQANTAYFDSIQLVKDVAGSYTYDKEGNIVTAKESGEKSQAMKYDDASNLTSLTDAENNLYEYKYNGAHQVTEAKSPMGQKVLFNYDDNGVNSSINIVNEEGTAKIKYGKTASDPEDGIAEGAYYKMQSNDHGKQTKYDYDVQKGTLQSVETPDGTVTSYTYQAQNDLLTGVSSGNDSVTYTYDSSKTRLTGIHHNDFDYSFTYDKFGNLVSTSAADKTLVTNTYAANNGKLTQVTYGNGDTEVYTYNQAGEVSSLVENDDKTTEWRYDASSTLLWRKDYESRRQQNYEYDITGRVLAVTIFDMDAADTEQSARLFETRYAYDSLDQVKKEQIYVDGNYLTTGYTYNKNRQPEEMFMAGGETKTYLYDTLGRLSGKETEATAVIKQDYSYWSSDRNDTLAESEGKPYRTTQVAKELMGNLGYYYTYDNVGNIIKIESGTRKEATTTFLSDQTDATYQYDSKGQLIREDNYVLNQTITYEYNAGGNLTGKKIYPYIEAAVSLEGLTPVQTIPYLYGNEWKDQLTSYNGSAITYDNSGNPVSYLGKTLDWQGRELRSLAGSGLNVTYNYDTEGLRTEKTVNGVTHEYFYSNGLLMYEEYGNKKLYYTYDFEGNLSRIRYEDGTNGRQFYYPITNTRGDVQVIFDASGTVVAEYVYDAWGRTIKIVDGNGTVITSADHIAHVNPIRYRGYYYDAETGFYYVSSRYYDPEVGRFISADTTDILGVSSDFYDKNLYAYCDNNPVTRMDADGEFWTIASGAVIGAVISAGIEFGMQLATGGKIDMVNIGLAALGGAAGGALAATSFGYVGQVIGNAAISGISEAISQVRNGNRDLGSIALSAGKMAAVGAASVYFGGKGIKAKGTAYSNSLNNLNSVKSNVSKALSNPKGYRQQINRAIKTHQTTTRAAVKSTTKSFAKASFFSNFVGRVKSFFGW